MPSEARDRAQKVREELGGRYREALVAYLREGGEEPLQEAWEVAREALSAHLGLMDLAALHRAALASLEAGLGHEDALRAAGFFHECLGPYEMAQRGYQDAVRELREQHSALQRAHQALEQSERQKAQLGALIVHDLKSPLAGIEVNLRYLLRDKALDTDGREALEDGLLAAASLRRMVADLLDVYRAEQGQLTARLETVHLAPLLEGVRRVAQARAAFRRQNLQVHAAQAEVCADPDLLRRVLENLLDNAIKHAPTGGAVEVAVKEGAQLRLEVHDSGRGIPPEKREGVFEQFVQLDAERGPRSSHGLGLVFCRLAVEAHGGRIWVEDSPLGGAAFCVQLPRTGAEAKEAHHG